MEQKSSRLFLMLLLGCSVVTCSDNLTLNRKIDKLFLNYDKNDPPITGKPTTVAIGMYMINMKIDDKAQEISADFYLRQAWTDPRLAFGSANISEREIRLSEETASRIWKPDTFIRQAKNSHGHSVPTKAEFIKLAYDGKIWHVRRITTVMYFPMHFHKYPFDSQRFEMSFESFGYTAETVILTPMSVPFDLSKSLIQFAFLGAQVLDCSQNYTSGTYPCLAFEFSLRREIAGPIFCHVYLPTLLMVFLSWAAFWINPSSTAARLVVGLVSLAMTWAIISSHTYVYLPKTSCMTKLDVWLVVCSLFIFFSLLEHAAVDLVSRMTDRTWNLKLLFHPSAKGETIQQTARDDAASSSQAHRRVLLADWASRICFPIAFLLFNAVYWMQLRSG